MTTNTLTDTASTPVTVLGLGAMGSALARTFLALGHPVTVWNRTAARAEPLAAAGAATRGSAADAVAASPLVVVCLLDPDAVETVLADVGDAIAGKTLVDLTSSSPGPARRTGRWAAEHGAAYIDGGIMADPPDLGTDRARLSFSGSRTAYDAHESVLRGLGSIAYYGEDPGLASVEFMAQVGLGYELLQGLLHTLRLVEVEGADVADFAARFADSLEVGYPAVVRAIGKAVRERDYQPDLGPLSVQRPLMDDLIEHRRATGVDVTRMIEVRQLMDERIAAGHMDEGFSSLFAALPGDR